MDDRASVKEQVRIPEIETSCSKGHESLILVPLENHLALLCTNRKHIAAADNSERSKPFHSTRKCLESFSPWPW